MYTNATPFLVLGGKYVCGYCNGIIEDPNDLREHIKRKHKLERVRNVSRLLRPAEVKEIMRLDVVDLKCTVCGVKIMEWELLYQHLERHGVFIDESRRNKIVPYQLMQHQFFCPICKLKMNAFKFLEMHLAEHFENYICQECGKRFLFYNKLKSHQYAEKQNALQFQCDKCEEIIVGK